MVVSVMVLENGKGLALPSEATSPARHPLRARKLRHLGPISQGNEAGHTWEYGEKTRTSY